MESSQFVFQIHQFEYPLLYIHPFPHLFITMLPSFHRNFDSHRTVLDFAFYDRWAVFSQDPLSTRPMVAFAS